MLPQRSLPVLPGPWASRSRAKNIPVGGPASAPFHHISFTTNFKDVRHYEQKNQKAYKALVEKLDKGRLYTPLKAAQLVKETSSKNFDASVDVAIRLGVDPRKADQLVRGTVRCRTAPVRPCACVFAAGEKATEAEAAGADVVGSDDLIARITEGWTDFDVAIANPRPDG